MNKAELVSYIFEETGIKKAAVESVLNSLAAAARQSLGSAGDEMTLPDIGKLKIKHVPARTARNPATGATVQVAEKLVVKFTPAKALKESV